MLLKDKLKKVFNKKTESDKIKLPVMDGFVDIKGYKNGKMFYHDCGDNVVTDWMRQAIITMLAGISFTNFGDMPKYVNGVHGSPNPDGYCFNGKQYEETIKQDEQVKYCSSWSGYKYATFPTKILFGTGKEYTDWNTLRSENESTNSDWYNDMLNTFGSGYVDTAQTIFDGNIADTTGDTVTAGKLNDFSGTITNGVYSGDGEIARCRTVNDPDSSTTEVASAVSMYRNYGVVGAIKTPYISGVSDYTDMLQNIVSESGRLLKPAYRGVGSPAFIYFNQQQKDPESKTETWGSDAAEVYISKETDNKHLTKITFTVTLPEQSSSTSAEGKYYPYNGFTLKQIGLYNDSQVVNKPDSVPNTSDGAYYTYTNMKHGTLLAVKNIAPFSKQASSSYVISWTLTI